MRVAVVYPIAFGNEGSYGGGERYALELSRALSSRVDCRLVTIGRTRARRFDGDLRIDTYAALTHVRGSISNPLSLAFLRSLSDVDVIHCTSYSTLMTDFAVLYGRAFHKRVFVTDIGGGGSVSLARMCNVAAMTDGLLLLSKFGDRAFPPGAPKRWVIYGGVKETPVDPQSDRHGVLYAGRILPHKGIDVLVDGLPDGTALRVVGQEVDHAYLRDLQEQSRGKDVTFVLDADDRRLAIEYQRAAVAVLPSVYVDRYGGRLAAPELLGLTLLEAMSAGTPVLCTAVGSLPELVQDGVTGLVVPPNDAPAIRRALTQLLSDPARARAIGMAARDHVMERFRWDAVATRVLRIYEGREPALDSEAAA